MIDDDPIRHFLVRRRNSMMPSTGGCSWLKGHRTCIFLEAKIRLYPESGVEDLMPWAL